MSRCPFRAAALALLCICLFCVPARAADAGYTITDYVVEAVWHENNSVSVREHIEVDFTEESHGIYRTMPTYFYLGEAAFGGDEPIRYETGVRNIDAGDEPFEASYEDSRCRIRIGDADTLLLGAKSYDISFTYGIPDDRLNDFDFLYWSALGAEWETSIDRFAFTLRFDKPLPQSAVDGLQIVSGRYGSETNALDVAFSATATEITGEANEIGPYRAITLYTRLPQGYFVGAKAVTPVPLYLSAALFALTALAALVRIFSGKKRRPVRTVQFYPPDGVSSAEVGVIMDEEVNEVDIFSLIPLWAQRGYLTLEEPDKKTMLLHKTAELPSNAPQYQKTFWSALFGSKGKAFYTTAQSNSESGCNLRKLDDGFYGKFKKTRSELEAVFTGERQLSTGKRFASVLVVCAGAFCGLVETFNSRIRFADGLILAVFTGGLLILWGLLRVGLRGKLTTRKAKVRFVLASLGLLFFPVINTLVDSGAAYDYFLPHPIPLVLLAVVILIVALAGELVKDTDYKVEMVGKLLGLKEFIRIAELPRLQMLINENPGYYYDILPYAMVFGLADKWAKQFEPLALAPPDWYTGCAYTRGARFDPYGFQRGLQKNVVSPMREVNARAAAHETSSGTASSTSSSSSGGFSSGGGGGGGGGGRW